MSIVLVLLEVGAILGNGYGIQGQNDIALLYGSVMPARFHYRNLILGMFSVNNDECISVV